MLKFIIIYNFLFYISNIQFVAFINLAGVAYRECLFEFEEQKKSFETLQFAIADLQKQLQKHENETRIQEKSLESVYNVFWKKLKVDFPSTPALEHEGYLWKKGSGFTKSWQKRYFICKNHKLAYYHNADDSDKPQGELPLLLTTIKPIVDSDRRFTFTIISTGKTYTLQALTKYDMDEWMAVIKNNIQYLLDHSDEKSEKSVQSKNDKVSDILALECNKHCADCGAECPTWCCINWGVCICINCSGIHRSFTPISKVRSLTLDRLDNYSKRALEALNNENANSILEANIGHNKIEPNCSKEEREEFIRRKYIKCKFVDDSKEVDILEAIRSKNAPAVLHALCLHRKQGKPMQTSGYTPLHLAASLGDPIICHIIATNMKTPDILDDAGWSPLSYATYYGHAEACECLIQNNCDPRLSKAAHPYQIAMSQNKTNLVAMFLPYWDGNPDTVPDQEFKPPVQTDIGVTQSVNQKYASLDILGTLQF
ncbi:ARF GAP-like zinc finger-containing protein [Tritrichomonas foetus]|uniref:ARF GAP-like zinc finger-containing protein n=1 Tax=Tritrichomonas foetus TaxID=1144522 RepID=A0A1J4K746_9EUKA|nr:ARF GAP-like zinc finger-containing protein [Tritrichomonas foetus]|eukprot:OHT05524.1 ARF GAP-like zinc finger-containing protein [Tritrichomonas foetus]